jgi:hypothetical protein
MTRYPRRVVAINLGGQQNTLQWGVLVDRATLLRTMSALEQEGVARLDADHPQLVVREFEAPHRLLDGDPGATSKLDLALHRNSALAMLSSSTPVDPFGAVGHSLQLGWSHQWFSLPMALLDTSFGTRVIAGGLFGQYRSPVAQDVNDRHQPHEDPLRGSARLPFYGGFGEADAELHLARLLPIHYVVALGLRGGVSHQRYVRDGGNTFVWGPVLSGQAKWQLSDALSGVLQVHVEVQRIPVAATPADCHSQTESCSSQPWTPAWDVWAGLGLGAEWAL